MNKHKKLLLYHYINYFFKLLIHKSTIMLKILDSISQSSLLIFISLIITLYLPLLQELNYFITNLNISLLKYGYYQLICNYDVEFNDETNLFHFIVIIFL